MDKSIRDSIEKDFQKFFNNIGRKKEYIGDLVTIKARGLKNCSLNIYDPTPRFDIVPDSEYGIIKTKFIIPCDNERKTYIGTSRNFDTLFLVILNKGKRIVEKIYAIPKKELEGKRVVSITDTGCIYEKFRINEKPYNDIYSYMKTEKYSITEDDSITCER